MRGIGKVFQGLESMGVPHWVVGLLFFGSIIILLSYIFRHLPLSRARRLVKRSAQAPRTQRAAMEREAMAIVWDLPVGLLIVGQEAVQRGRLDLATRALARLHEIGERPGDIGKLEDDLYGTNRPRLGVERVVICGLLEEGLLKLAAERLIRAREIWPDDEGLRSLDSQLQVEISRTAECVEGRRPPAA